MDYMIRRVKEEEKQQNTNGDAVNHPPHYRVT